MKKYNIANYIRYKEDIKAMKPKGEVWDYFDREEVIKMYLPLVENIARKFPSSQQAIGVLTIMDLIQEGSYGLVRAVDRLDWSVLENTEDIEKTLKSFFSKRIKGAIRRRIDMYRGNMRIPEHKLNEIRKNFGKDKKMVEMFFNSIFLSIDANPSDENMVYQIPDESEPYNIEMMNAYLTSLLKQHLTDREFDVIRLSYGLDCGKHTASEIADILGIEGSSSYVRVSQLKKQAVDKLIENVDHSQVIDYL